MCFKDGFDGEIYLKLKDRAEFGSILIDSFEN